MKPIAIRIGLLLLVLAGAASGASDEVGGRTDEVVPTAPGGASDEVDDTSDLVTVPADDAPDTQGDTSSVSAESAESGQTPGAAENEGSGVMGVVAPASKTGDPHLSAPSATGEQESSAPEEGPFFEPLPTFDPIAPIHVPTAPPASPPSPAAAEAAPAVLPPQAPSTLPGEGSYALWAALALAALSIGLAIALATIRMLLAWHRHAKDQRLTAFPEAILWEFDAGMRSQKLAVEDFARDVVALAREVRERDRRSSRQLDDLLASFATLQRALDQKDEEVARLRAGYDAEIFRRFVRRFLRVDEALREALERFDPEKAEVFELLIDLRELMADALDECGVVPFQPQVGESIKTAVGVADRWRKVSTDSPDRHFTIAQVLAPGMGIRTPQGLDVVKHAVVEVFVHEPKAGSDVVANGLETSPGTQEQEEGR